MQEHSGFDDKDRLRRYTWRLASSIGVSLAAMTGGLVTYAEYGQRMQIIELAVAGVSAAGAAKLMSAKNDGHGFGEAMGLSLAWLATVGSEAGMAGWSGGGAQSVWAGLLGTAVSYALLFAWQEHRRHDELERYHRVVKIENDRYMTKANIELKDMQLTIKQMLLDQKLAATQSESQTVINLPDTWDYQALPKRNWDAPVVLGIDEHRNLVEIELAPHAAIAGSTGFGKSTLVNSLIIQLAERDCVRVIGVDLKPFSPEFTPLEPILFDLVTDLEGTHAKLDWVLSELHRRGEMMRARGWRKWQPSEDDPIFYVFVDEYMELIRLDKAHGGKKKFSRSVQDKVESILAMARAYGIFLVLCTQQPSAKMFGEDTGARGNLPIRICFSMTESIHDRYVLPAMGGWNTSMLGGRPGRFLLFSTKHRDPHPYLAFWVSDDVVGSEVDRISLDLENRTTPSTLHKKAGGAPDREDLPRAIMAQLALGPASKREMAEKLGIRVDDWKLKEALQALSGDKEIQYSTDRRWHLVD